MAQMAAVRPAEEPAQAKENLAEAPPAVEAPMVDDSAGDPDGAAGDPAASGDSPASPSGPPSAPAPSGSGKPLPDGVRALFERAMAADFSDVRVIEEASVARLGAQAFTQGSSIHFAPGKYSPDTGTGRILLGHELQHVIQQRAGRVKATGQAKGIAINDDAGLEAEADVMGAAAASGVPVGGGGGGAGGSSGVAQAKGDVQGVVQAKGDLPVETIAAPDAGAKASTEATPSQPAEPVTIQWFTPAFDVQDKKGAAGKASGKDKEPVKVMVAGTAIIRGQAKDGTPRPVTDADQKAVRLRLQAVAKQVALHEAEAHGFKKLRSKWDQFQNAIGLLSMPKLVELKVTLDDYDSQVVFGASMSDYVAAKGSGQGEVEKDEEHKSWTDKVVLTSGERKKGETVTATIEDLPLFDGEVLIHSATVTGVWGKDDTLAEITGGEGVIFLNSDDPIHLSAKLRDMVVDVKRGRVSGSGTFTLFEDMTLGSRGDVSYRVAAGSHADITLDKNRVTSLSGGVEVLASDDEGDFFKVSLEDAGGVGKSAKDLSGKGAATLLRGIELATGVGPQGTWDLSIAPGTGLEVEVEAGKLKAIGGKLVVGVADGDGEFVRLMVQGTSYAHSRNPNISVTGVGAEVTRAAHLLTVGDYQVWTSESKAFGDGTGLKATVVDSELTHMQGKLPIEIRDAEGAVIGLEAEGQYDVKSGDLTGSGKAKLLRDWRVMPGIGPWSTWDLWMAEDSEITASVAKGALVSAAGKISVGLRKGDKDWLTAKAEGTYTHAQGTFTGTGAVQVHEEECVSVGPDGDVYLTSKTQADLKVTANQVDSVDGTLGLSLKEGGKAFGSGTLGGKYVAKTKDVSGTASLTFDADKVFVDTAKITIKKGTSASVALEKGALVEVTGTKVGVRVETVDENYGSKMDVELEGAAHYKVLEKLLATAEGKANLKSKWKVNDRFTLHKLDAKATVKDNTVKSLEGKLYGSIFDKTGAIQLFDGFIDGSWVGGVFTGEAGVTLMQDQEFAIWGDITAVVHKKKTKGVIAFVGGEMVDLTGSLDVDILSAGVFMTSLKGTGSFDIEHQNIKRLKAKAVFGKPKKLLKDNLTVEELSVAVVVVDNEITDAMGTAKISSEKLRIKKASVTLGWKLLKNKGEQYYVKGNVSWVFFKKKEKHLKGTLDVFYDWDGSWKARAKVDYQMAEGIGGVGDVSVDDDLVVTVHQLAIRLKKKLAEKDDLFDFNKNIDLLNLRLFLLLKLTFGISIGAKLSMPNDLVLRGNFEVKDWQPTGEDAEMTPEFSADLHMPMQLLFEAWVGAYLEASLDVFVAAAGLGVEARLVLAVPVNMDPTVTLVGNKDGWGGVFGMNLNIAPKLLLRIIPYLFAEVIFLDPYRGELDPPIEVELAKFTGMEMNEDISFGEAKNVAKAKNKRKEIRTAEEKEKSNAEKKPGKEPKTAKPTGADRATGKKVAVDGGDALPGDKLLTKQQGKSEGAGGDSKDGTQSKMEDMEDVMKGLKAVDNFMSWLGDVWDAMLTGGPVGGVMYVAWEVFKGNMTFAKLRQMYYDFMDGLKAAGRLIASMDSNPLSFTNRLGRYLAGEMSTFDLIMGADNEVVDMVSQGLHKAKDVGPEQHGAMLAILCGWDNACGGDEELAVIEILKEAGKRGHINSAIVYVEGSAYDGADQILYKLDGSSDTTVRAVFKRYGVEPGKEYAAAVAEEKRNKR